MNEQQLRQKVADTMTETEARALFVNTAKSFLGYSESSGKHRQIIGI